MLFVDDSSHAVDNGPNQMAWLEGQKPYGAFLLSSDKLGELLRLVMTTAPQTLS